MRENRTSGTVWGALGNRRSYHDAFFERIYMSRFVFFIFFTLNLIYSQSPPTSFSYLSNLEVDKGVKIYCNENYSVVINQKKDDNLIRVLKLKIDINNKEFYVIDYSPGLSFDPIFLIYKESSDSLKLIKSIFASSIYFPGNGVS